MVVKATLETEAALMKQFMETLSFDLPRSSGSGPILIPEFDGVQGRPDLVYATIRNLPEAIDRHALAASLRSPAKARILALLKLGTPRPKDYLEQWTGLSNRTFRSYLRQLQDVGLVEAHQNSKVSLRCRLPWNMIDIVAYEGKLHNWGRALRQARNYRTFSRSVWIVMPSATVWRGYDRWGALFRRNGTGLIAVDSDGARKIAIRGKKHRRPSSRVFYLVAAGLVLQRFVEADLEFGSESIESS